ncbi:MAG TPA: hypothetical protein VL282_14805, partial [Tepidisphaeraceae bacterium]|nr:hypothetical protein [Tepidisphaeraceae bacterium]
QLFASQASALPVEVLNRARKGARDAWCAVVLMGIFIVGGMSWTSARLDRADTRIAELLAQLQTEQNSSNLLRAENRQAFDELADVKAHLKAIQHEQSLSTR